MSQIEQAFQPPLYWQQFEDLTLALFPYIYHDNRPQKLGRSGQAQQGVDILGRCQRRNGWVGIQCKRMVELDEQNRPYPGGVVTKKLLRIEYEKARSFSPKLCEWVLATTAKRDADIQRVASELSEEAEASGGFRVSVWFWDDYITDLNRFHELQSRYYRSVLKLRNRDDEDRLILELFAYAFSRPAFEDPFHSEQPDDFLQAISDTQRVLNVGELLDRQTRHVIRRAIGGRRAIRNSTWRKSCNEVYQMLRKLKELFQQGLRQNHIRKHKYHLEIHPTFHPELDRLRQGCLDHMNDALRSAGVRRIGF